MKAAALLQAYARGVRKRMQDKEEAERKLEEATRECSLRIPKMPKKVVLQNEVLEVLKRLIRSSR